jgi:hypothetical protein
VHTSLGHTTLRNLDESRKSAHVRTQERTSGMLLTMSSTLALLKANILGFWPYFIIFCASGSWMETYKRIAYSHLQVVFSIVEK